MKSVGNMRKFRKADGHPEPRSVDEILRDAAARGEFDNLPGKGRPIDLGDYFSSDPENRVADRILRDNRILPYHLQGRKEAEDLEEAAQILLDREGKALQAMQEEIRRLSIPLVTCFQDRSTLLSRFDLPAFSPCFAEPSDKPHPDLSQALCNAERLRSMATRYNDRVNVFISRYLEVLERANTSIRQVNNRIVSKGRLTVGLGMMNPLDVSGKERETRLRFPPIPILPENISERLRVCFRERGWSTTK